MTGRLLLPEPQRILNDLSRRIRNLERRIQFRDTVRDREAIFSLAGSVIVSTSPKFYVEGGAVVRHVLCSLGTAGSTSTVVQIKRSGVVVSSITLVAGDTVERAAPQVAFGADEEPLTVGVSVAGTGAQDLTVQVRLG